MIINKKVDVLMIKKINKVREEEMKLKMIDIVGKNNN